MKKILNIMKGELLKLTLHSLIKRTFTTISLGLIFLLISAIEIPAQIILYDGLNFKVIDENRVEVCGPENKSQFSTPLCRIGSEIYHEGINYKVTGIAEYAFSGCENLKEIELPEGLTFIGARAFQNCYNLVSINFPCSLLHIDDYAFLNCESINVNVYLPKDCRVGLGTFRNCKSVESADISNLTEISEQAFMGCENLSEVIFSNDILEIPSYSFYGCHQLREVKFPDKLSHIGDYAFAYASGLGEIHFPRSIQTIGESAFLNCSDIEELNFDSEELTVGPHAFEGLLNLKTLYTSGIKEIQESAFRGCESLEWIEIASETVIIGSKAFSGCERMKAVYSHSEWAPWISFDTFDASTERCATLFVEENAVENYRMSPYWSDFKSILPTTNYPLSAEETEESLKIEYFPGKQVRIKSQDPIYIFDINGILIVGENKTDIYHLYHLSTGLYILNSPNGTKKLLIR